jgi:hypothetical protein
MVRFLKFYNSDHGFVRPFDGSCLLTGKDPFEPRDCKKGEKYLGSSGYRMISLSKCEGGNDLTQKVYRICGTNMKAGEVKIEASFFNSSVVDFYRLKDTSDVIIKNSDGLYQSRNGGSQWKEMFPGENVIFFFIDPHRRNRAFVITDKNTLYMTDNSADTFVILKTPCNFDLGIVPQPISTHASESNWIFLIGVSDCSSLESNCQTESFVSWDNGKSWNSMIKNALKCSWGYQGAFRSKNQADVFCLTIPDSDNPKRPLSKDKTLVKLTNPHYSLPETLFPSSEFAIYEHFMLAITVGMLQLIIIGIFHFNGHFRWYGMGTGCFAIWI